MANIFLYCMTKIIRYFSNIVIVVAGPNDVRILGPGLQFTCILGLAYSIIEGPKDSSARYR